MNKVLFAVMVLLAYLMVGCAAQNTTMAEPAATTMADSGGLPEIAPYNDAAIPALDAPATE